MKMQFKDYWELYGVDKVLPNSLKQLANDNPLELSEAREEFNIAETEKLPPSANSLEIEKEFLRLDSVAQHWSKAQKRQSVINTFCIRWGMKADEVSEIVDSSQTESRALVDDKPTLTSMQETESLVLRTQALGLLQQAEAIDGLKPYIVMHEHRFGISGYMAWHYRELNEADASSVLDEEFEEERGEVLTIESNVSLEELTGVSTSARPAAF